jgi:uncharacterized damage-inducible protein DinB
MNSNFNKPMKEYLIQTFNYNDWANKQLLTAILSLPDKTEAVKLFSHLITAQDKWLNRIEKKTGDSTLTWFGPVFPENELAQRWEQSITKWITLLEAETEAGLENKVTFIRPSDGKTMGVRLKDLALQLNYHSIHHRAQMNSLISRQGIKVPATDYIFTALEELD